jgi:hypothetical protein
VYISKSTPDPDPLAVEVSLRLSDPPSQYLNADLTRGLAAAAGAAPTPGLVNLLALAGVRICEQAPSLEEADREVVASVCWFAVRTEDAAEWLEGRHEGDAWRGRLAVNIRCGLYTAPEFARYWLARQRLAERIVDEFISYILELSVVFGLRSNDSDQISLFADTAKFDPVQTREECELRLTKAAILAGAPNPEDHEAARIWLYNQLRAFSPHWHPGRPWLMNLPLAVADHLKHLKEINQLPMLAPPAATPITAAPPAPAQMESAAAPGEKSEEQAGKIQPSAAELARKRREEVVMPLLNDRVWSVRRWVIEAGKAGGPEMDYSVGNGYLSGQSFPHRPNELALAKAIGLDKLPR